MAPGQNRVTDGASRGNAAQEGPGRCKGTALEPLGHAHLRGSGAGGHPRCPVPRSDRCPLQMTRRCLQAARRGVHTAPPFGASGCLGRAPGPGSAHGQRGTSAEQAYFLSASQGQNGDGGFRTWGQVLTQYKKEVLRTTPNEGSEPLALEVCKWGHMEPHCCRCVSSGGREV